MLAHRAAAMAEQPAQVGVATAADAQQPGHAVGAVLPEHQAEPGSQVTPAAELAGVAHRSHQGRGGERARAGDAQQAPAAFIGLGGGQLGVDVLCLLAGLASEGERQFGVPEGAAQGAPI